MEYDNVYEFIKKHFGSNFSQPDILDREIPLDIQMQFVERARILLDKEEKGEEEENIILWNRLLQIDEIETQRDCLANLSNCKNPKAFRIIEEFEKNAGKDLKDWAYLALRSSKMKLESFFLEKNGVLVSSGLGGKEGKLRYFVVFFSNTSKDFSENELAVINKELLFYTEMEDGEIELFEAYSYFVKIKILLPLRLSLRVFFKKISNACQETGVKLNEHIIITNVNILSNSEIETYFNEKKE